MPSDIFQGTLRNGHFHSRPIAAEYPGKDVLSREEFESGTRSGTRTEDVTQLLSDKAFKHLVAYNADFEGIKGNADLSDTGRAKLISDTALKALATLDTLEGQMVTVSDERARLAERVSNIGFKAGEVTFADVMLEQEVRRDLEAMDKSKRMSVARDAINNGDAIVARAIFNAPRYKALFLAEVQQELRRLWTNRVDPLTGARLAWFETAEAMLRQNFKTVRSAIESDLPSDVRRRITQSNA